MINIDKKEINFIGMRKAFFTVSIILVAMSLIVIGFRVATHSLKLSSEFVGGSTIAYVNVDDSVTEQSIRDSLSSQGYDDEATIQTLSSNGNNGFLAKIDTTDVQQAESLATSTANELGVPTSDVQVSTIGPNWGASVITSSILAFVVGMLLILFYVWVRFRDVKMGVVAIIALLHDMIIVLGVYALVGRELTPNTVAAVLTIMGYSLYDTVVTFHSINDNANSGKLRENFYTIANHSINQVIVRTMNTTITTLVPVIFMLFFGGTTLTDFAFAMTIGLIVGAYSSFGIASPLYTLWKSHELDIAKINVKYGTKVNTDTAEILRYDKNVDDLPSYRKEIQARLA